MITAEWCKREARVCMETSLAFRGADKLAGFGDAYERTAAALTIAARVLDEGAVEGVARVAWDSARWSPEMPSFAHEMTWDDVWPGEYAGFRELFRQQARAVLAYLRGYEG